MNGRTWKFNSVSPLLYIYLLSKAIQWVDRECDREKPT